MLEIRHVLQNPTNMAISFALLIAAVGGSFAFVQGLGPVELPEGQEPWELGIRGSNMTPEIAQDLEIERQDGFVVLTVMPGGVAESKGFREGDVIIGIDGTEVRNSNDINAILSQKGIGDQVRFTILRATGENDATLDISVEVGQPPD